MPVLMRSAYAPARAKPGEESCGALVWNAENDSELPLRRGRDSLATPQPAWRWPRLWGECANPACRAGWLQLWRSRSAPVFEEGWCCSPECTHAQVEAALRREMDARAGTAQVYRHRIPLGLSMLEQGWITAVELRRALAAQREAHGGRLGEWLRRQGVSEELITRALGVQWSCPVLSLDQHQPGGAAAALPRLLVDALRALPLRSAAERVLYLGFEERLDPALALAVERMTGLRVESGLVGESQFRRAHARALEARYPAAELVETGSQEALASVLAQAIERARPVASRLVRVHECLWLRLWLRPQSGALPALDGVCDLIASPSGTLGAGSCF